MNSHHSSSRSLGLRQAPLTILCLTVVACLTAGSCSTDNASRGDRLTAESELPPDYAAAWRAWYENSDSWPDWRPKVAADPRMANFFADNLVRVMVKHYDHARLTRPGQLPGLFERSQRELLYLSEYSGPLLVEFVFVGDGVVSFLAGDLLVRMDDARRTLPVAQKLTSAEAEDRRRAAEWLGRLPTARDEEEAVWQLLERAALEDSEWFVRAQAMLTLGERSLIIANLERARGTLSRGLADPDPAVIQAACEALRRNRDLRALPALINLLERNELGPGDPAVMIAAQASLRRLTELKGDRKAAQWRAWWRENRP